MKLKLLSVSLSLCLVLMIIGSRASSAQEVQPLDPEWLTQMYEEGWHKVQEGVLQRDTGGGRLETFGYGAEGLQWLMQGYEHQLARFEEEYEGSPSEELAELIHQLRSRIDRLEGDLGAAPSAESFDGNTLDACSLPFDPPTASAGPQQSPQGATAAASAIWESDCGAVGETFAYAHAHAKDGTLETTVTQTDPQTGTSIQSHVSASANGTTDCFSEAQAEVRSTELNFFRQTPLERNFDCRAVLEASITGPAAVTTDHYTSECADVTWTASATGGHPGGYTYEWYLGTDTTVQGTGNTFTQRYCSTTQSVAVKVVARDADGYTDDATFATSINDQGPIVPRITGPATVTLTDSAPCADVTWTASATSSGHTGYSYDWYIGTVLRGSGATLTERYCSTRESVTVRLVARASNDAHEDSTTHTTEITAGTLIIDAGAPNGSDDTATLQRILDAGDIVSLRPGQTYRLSQRLNITKSKSGIITVGTPAVLYLMNTFNNVEPLQVWDATRVDSVAIRAEGSLAARLDNIRLENFKIEKQHLDGTYVTGVWFRGVSNSRIVGLDISGFALGHIIAIDSSDNVSIRGCYIHDSWANHVNSYAKFPYLRGIVVDDNKFDSDNGPVGSTRVTIANNTISRLRFGSNLYNLQRGQFQGMSGTSPVGYQTDGITVVPGNSGTVVVGNVIENAGEGIDCMGNNAVIRSNKVRDIFDWGIKFVHGSKMSLVEDNDVGAAGTGSIVVFGTNEARYGHSFGHLIRKNRITRVGGLNAFCGSAVPAPYRIFSTCPTTPAASAFTVMPNGGAGLPRYNLFSGNTVTAVASDVRMKNLIRVDAPAEHSLFFGNSFTNQTGRTIGNQIQTGTVGTIIDPTATSATRADFGGDGRDDWFVHWKSSGQNYLYRQNSDETFTRLVNPINTGSTNGSPDNLLSGDFNRDGYADLLFHWKSAGTNRLYLSNALGSFQEVLDPMNVSNVGGNPDDALTGDFNGDGYADVFFFWRQPGINRFYYGGAGGAFSEHLDPIVVTAINSTPNRVLVGDFDGDAKSDLLFYWGDGTNRFFYGTGTGSFTKVDDPIIAGEINGSQTVITLDANRDGRDDVLFWWPAGELRRMYLGQGNRTFLRE